MANRYVQLVHLILIQCPVYDFKVLSSSRQFFQVLDNSTYYCGTEYGEMTLPKKGTDRRYHIVGELRFLKKSSFRELSAHLLLIIKAAGKAQVIIWIPLPRWLHFACCMDPSHLINRGDTDFIENMHEALRDLRGWLEDMIDLRKLANVSLYNPCDALNMTGPDMDNWT
jgi:hypothetical protein